MTDDSETAYNHAKVLQEIETVNQTARAVADAFSLPVARADVAAAMFDPLPPEPLPSQEGRRLARTLREAAMVANAAYGELAEQTGLDEDAIYLLLEECLGDPELDPEVVCRVAGLLGVDPSTLPRPVTWGEEVARRNFSFVARRMVGAVATLAESLVQALSDPPARLVLAWGSVRSGDAKRVPPREPDPSDVATVEIPVLGVARSLVVTLEIRLHAVHIKGAWDLPLEPAVGVEVELLSGARSLGRVSLDPSGEGDISVNGELDVSSTRILLHSDFGR